MNTYPGAGCTPLDLSKGTVTEKPTIRNAVLDKDHLKLGQKSETCGNCHLKLGQELERWLSS